MAENRVIPRPDAQRGYIRVIDERCKGCDLCIPACPVDIIDKAGPEKVNWMGWTPVEVADDAMKYCLACNLCAWICPDQAIEVFKFATAVPHAELAERAQT